MAGKNMTQYRHINAKELQTSSAMDYIGEGSFGKVYKAYNKKLGICAAKLFQVTGTVDRQTELYQIIMEEANLLSLVNHKNIVRFHGVSCWSHYVAIIMDYEVMGSLHSLLQKTTVTVIPWKLRLRMVQEAVRALVYLHHSGIEQRIVHGDLKSSNILLSEDLRILIADFGAASLATKTSEKTSHIPPPNARVHTVAYSAPEFLEDVFAIRTKAMDIFSLGRVIYELITRKSPFFEQNIVNMTDAIINGAIPDVSMIPKIKQDLMLSSDEELNVVPFLEELMNDCCKHNAADRPEILQVQMRVEEMMRPICPTTLMKCVVLVINQMNVVRQNSPVNDRVTFRGL